LFSLVYHRGFSIAVGPEAPLNGHILSASFSQWLSQRVNLQISSGYNRGASLKDGSKLEYLSGNAELQIALQRHLMLSGQYSYVSQRGANLFSDEMVLNRYTVSAGLQFLFPALSDR
jgi:hypothetical protein